MAFVYHHLDDPEVREKMVGLWQAENESLRASGKRAECYGADLLEEGWAEWEVLMPRALAEHDDGWLIDQMLDSAFWRSHRIRKDGIRSRVSPSWAAKMLCQGEFNIAYVHGLAEVLQARGQTECVVYRAESASVPRCECSEWEEQAFPLAEVIAGHRARYWPLDKADPDVFSVPSGFNCHHSIRALDAPAA